MTTYGKILWAIIVFDLLTTVIGLELGIVEEANPIMAFFLRSGGLPLFIFIKIAISFAAIGILEYIYGRGLLPQSRMRFYYVSGIIGYCFIFLGGSAYLSFYV